MGLSAAITYLVERMIASGHIRRESDPSDRRKVILRYAEHGIAVARTFFTPLADQSHAALADLPDENLAAAHRVLTTLCDAMRTFQAELSARTGAPDQGRRPHGAEAWRCAPEGTRSRTTQRWQIVPATTQSWRRRSSTLGQRQLGDQLAGRPGGAAAGLDCEHQ